MASLAPSVSRQDRAFRFSADRKCDDTTGETTTNMVVESRFLFHRPNTERRIYA
jgi:hypothetical protein